jgi:hypothetical protein
MKEDWWVVCIFINGVLCVFPWILLVIAFYCVVLKFLVMDVFVRNSVA